MHIGLYTRHFPTSKDYILLSLENVHIIRRHDMRSTFINLSRLYVPIQKDNATLIIIAYYKINPNKLNYVVSLHELKGNSDLLYCIVNIDSKYQTWILIKSFKKGTV